MNATRAATTVTRMHPHTTNSTSSMAISLQSTTTHIRKVPAIKAANADVKKLAIAAF